MSEDFVRCGDCIPTEQTDGTGLWLSPFPTFFPFLLITTKIQSEGAGLPHQVSLLLYAEWVKMWAYLAKFPHYHMQSTDVGLPHQVVLLPNAGWKLGLTKHPYYYMQGKDACLPHYY